jgi:Domain of unknown function (DUF4328)
MVRTPNSRDQSIAFALTLTAGILLALCALGAAFVIDVLTFDLRWRHELQRHHAAGPELARSHSWLMGLAHVLPFVLGPTIVAWLAWQWQAEIRRTSDSPPRYRPETILLAWVIPWANLVVPARAMAEMWARAEPDRPDRRGVVLVAAWWVALLATVGLSVFALATIPGHGATNIELIIRDHRFVAAGAAAIVSALLALILVTGVNLRQASGAKRVAEAGSPSWRAMRSRA